MTKDVAAQTMGTSLQYPSPKRGHKLVNYIIMAVILVLPVSPVLVLYRASSESRVSEFEAVGLLTVFTLLFSAAMSSLTRARRHEILAASAAYCAVLVVLIDSFQ